MQNDFLATIKRLSNDYETTMTDTLSTIASDYQRLLNDCHISTIERLSTIKPMPAAHGFACDRFVYLSKSWDIPGAVKSIKKIGLCGPILYPL